jgi:hypothetical protein
MRSSAAAVLLLLASCARTTVDRRDSPPPASAQEAQPAFDREANAVLRKEEAEEDLWYGTPGVRAGGGDIVSAVLGFFAKLFTRPAELLDFNARTQPPPPDERLQRALDAYLRRVEADP